MTTNREFLLTIDQGNTRIKATLFKNSNLLQRAKSIEEVILLVSHNQLNNYNCIAICSNVGKSKIDLLNLDLHDVSQWFIDGHFLGMKVNYATTLGIDRLAAAFYTYQNFPNSWVIDSGTFTKVDFTSKDGFEGGIILPGLELLQNSYTHGEQLFKAPLTKNTNLLPNSTDEAIGRGAFLAFCSPVLQALSERSFNHILITGGNGELLFQEVKRCLPSASIHFKPDLIDFALLEIAKKAELI